MKKYKQLLWLLPYSLLYLVPNAAHTQNFGAPGTQWHYNGHNAAPPEYSGHIRFTGTLDTVVLGRPTHKIAVEQFSYQGDSSAGSPIFIYEHQDTVFLYSASRNKFLVFYLFNRQQGDTITLDAPEILPWADSTYRLVIDSVWQTTIDNVTVNVYDTDPLDAFFISGNKFMDRVGGLNWFFPITFGIPEGPGPIRCYADPDIMINFQQYPCDYRLSTGTASAVIDSALIVYPNPASDVINVRLPPDIYRGVVRVCNTAGQAFLQHPIQPSSNEKFAFRVNELAEGMYWLQILDADTAYRPVKFQVQR